MAPVGGRSSGQKKGNARKKLRIASAGEEEVKKRKKSTKVNSKRGAKRNKTVPDVVVTTPLEFTPSR
jgi:hypothetical protein